MSELTKADLDALKALPAGWFRAEHLPIRCPMYRCERLETRGKLVRRVVGTWPNIWSEYMITEGGAA